MIFTSTCETLFKPYVAEWQLLDHLPLFWIGNHTYTTSCTDSTFPRTPNSLSRNSSHILSSINKTWCHQQSLAPKTSGLSILFLLGYESVSSFICSTYTYPNLTVVYLRFVFIYIYTYPSCISYPIQRSAFLWAFWWDFGSCCLLRLQIFSLLISKSFCQGSRVVFGLWFWIVILTDGFYSRIGLGIVSSDPKSWNANTAACLGYKSNRYINLCTLFTCDELEFVSSSSHAMRANRLMMFWLRNKVTWFWWGLPP